MGATQAALSPRPGSTPIAVRFWLTHLTSLRLSPSPEEKRRDSDGDSRLLFNHRASLLVLS